MTENKKEYKLSIINDGEPFVLEKWTVKKNKDVLAKMAKEEEKNPKITEEEKDLLYQNFVIIRGLKHIDSSLKEKDLDDLHPLDKNALFTAILYSGREGIVVKKSDDAGKKRKSK
jgi:hypothetical protein